MVSGSVARQLVIASVSLPPLNSHMRMGHNSRIELVIHEIPNNLGRV